MVYLPGPSSLDAKWFRYRVSIHHPLGFNWHPLKDHPMTCKWLKTMVIVSPLSRDIPVPNGLNGLYMGVTNQLLTGMILQVGTHRIHVWYIYVYMVDFYVFHVTVNIPVPWILWGSIS